MIFRSPYPDVEIPDVTVTSHVLRRVDELGDKTALVDWPTGREIGYRELAESIHRVAGGLTERGLRKGDVFAIFSPNNLYYPTAVHGATYAGGVVTTANPRNLASELARQLESSGARFLLTVGAVLDKAREAAEAVGGIEEIMTFDDVEGTTAFSDLLAADPLEVLPDIDPPADLAVLPYSSGTTGMSKGVMLTHRNLVANMAQVEGTASHSRAITEDDTIVAVIPFFHIYGMGVLMNYALSRGATIVVHPGFDLDELLSSIEQYGVTCVHIVPPIVLRLAQDPRVDEYDLSTVELVHSGGAPLGSDLARAVEERLDCVVSQGYGLTETSPAVVHAANKERGLTPYGSIGRCLPNTEIKLVDINTGLPVGRGERGELWIRGPQVMAGYLGRPEATAEAVDEDGWLHTGDVAYADEEGNFFIVDRVKELIKFKGFQVAPAELEAVLLNHPEIHDTAVIPSPQREAGEVPKAFVVGNGSLTAQEVMDFVAERVAPHKKVRRVEFVDEIPKSPSGKILRRVLVERERRAVDRAS